MADNESTISMAGINAPPLYRLVEDGDKTVIVTADTNTPMWVINGKIGGDTVETMTTAERTAITPEAGKLIFDTTLGILFVGDGSTVGGTAVGGGGGGGVVPGYRLTDDGTSLNFNPVQPIVTVAGSSVTLVPDTAYKMYATTGAVTINANPPASGYWGLESHIELFVGSTGYIVTGTNVVLANALEPDSVNNCTVRFHDGIAIISVEDHVAGYIVVNGSTSGDGSLYYGIATSTNDYVAFDASLNGSVIPLAGAVAEGEKHLVGNGYAETTLTGAVDCGANKVTVANLALQDVVVNGGTMTLGDAFIPSGSTVAVSGGGLAVEKVTGAGSNSVIDLGGYNSYQSGAIISGCTITNGRDFRLMSKATDCVFSGNSTIYAMGVYSNCTFCNNIDSLAGGIMAINNTSFFGCTFSGSTGSGNLVVSVGNNYSVSANITDCTLAGKTILQNGALVISGSASMNDGTIERRNLANVTGSVTLTNGATLDLTGNSNPTPIAPGGGITFEQGGATVLYSSGAVSGSYMMDNVTLPAGAKLTNTNVVNLGGSRTVISSGATASASGCTITGGAGGGAAAFYNYGDLSVTDCTVSGNTATNGTAIRTDSGATTTILRSVVSGNVGGTTSKDVYVGSGGVCTVNGCTIGVFGVYGTAQLAGENTIGEIAPPSGLSGTVTISSGAIINLTSSIAPGGTGGITVLTGGCTVNGNAIPAGTYTSIDSNGQPT